MSDFSLMDAIECGIVKLPRVPVADNIPGADMPDVPQPLGTHPQEMPKKGRGKAGELDPLNLPTQLADGARSALRPLREDLRALGRSRASASRRASSSSATTPATSKLVYDYISGFHRDERRRHDAASRTAASSCSATSTSTATRSPRPNTLLIDSEQLESGEALDDNFREMAADEIERFRREIVERTGDAARGRDITDPGLLREVMNTVGKQGPARRARSAASSPSRC